MWPRLILSLLLVQCLAASPAPAPATRVNRATWSAEEACADKSTSVMIKNENDSTCVSFVLCFVANDGSSQAVIKNCRSGQYFNSSLGFCSVTKPDGCV